MKGKENGRFYQIFANLKPMAENMGEIEIADWLLDKPVKIELFNEKNLKKNLKESDLDREDEVEGITKVDSETKDEKGIVCLGRISKVDGAIVKIQGPCRVEDCLLEGREVKVSVLGDGKVIAYFNSKISQFYLNTYNRNNDSYDEATVILNIPDENDFITSDYRENSRMTLDNKVLVKFLSYKGEFLPKEARYGRHEQLMDISKSGVKLKTKFNVRIGLRANLQFDLRHNKIDVSADVVWIEKQDDFYICGLEFINLEQGQAKIIEGWVNYLNT